MQVSKVASKGHHTLYLNVNERVPEDHIMTNKTLIDWSLQIYVASYNFYSMNVNIKFGIDGVDKYNKTFEPDCRNKNQTYTVASGTVEVEHNSDGKKSINFYANWTDIDTASYMPGTCYLDGSMTLTTIPRTTACPSLNGDVESSYNIPLNPASNTFKHGLKVTFGRITKWVNASGNLQATAYHFTNSNIPFTIPSEFYKEFTEKSKTGTLTLYTYNDTGTSLIGSATSTLIINCNESKCRPVIEGTLKDINPVTLELTGDNDKVIKGFSTLEANFTTLKSTSGIGDNSTITSQTINNVVFTGSKTSLENVTSNVVNIVVTNSRGFSTTKQLVTIGELIDYFSPLLTIEPYRIDQTSDNIKLTYSGKFFNQSFGNVSNSLTMNWYYKEDTYNAEWVLGGSIMPTFKDDEIVKSTIDCGEDYVYTKNFRFKVDVVDKLSNISKEETVTAGIPNFDFGDGYFQHHTDVTDKNGNQFLGFVCIDEVELEE